MFDLGRLVDAVSSIAEAAGAPGNGIQQQLADLGIDPANLQGLEAGQIAELLQQHGVDVAGLNLDELTGVIEHLGSGESLVSGVSNWLSGQLGRS